MTLSDYLRNHNFIVLDCTDGIWTYTTENPMYLKEAQFLDGKVQEFLLTNGGIINRTSVKYHKGFDGVENKSFYGVRVTLKVQDFVAVDECLSRREQEKDLADRYNKYPQNPENWPGFGQVSHRMAWDVRF